jgi:hypothetical protein
MPARKRSEKTEPTPPEPDVRKLQDPEQTVGDFLGDLKRASTNKAKQLLDDDGRSGRDRGSPKT